MAGAESDGDFQAFWQFYLQEHADPRTRAIHYAGACIAVAGLVAVIVLGKLWFLTLVPIAGYGPGLLAHALIEKNRPLVLRHPLRTFVCDLRMTFAWVTGQIDEELARAGVAPPKR